MRRLIRANGEVIDLPDKHPLDRLHAMIGAEYVDSVILRHMGDPLHVMILDDKGWEVQVIKHPGNFTEHVPVRALKPINHEATRLYHMNCRVGTTHQIAGDVVVCPDTDFIEGQP